MVTSNFPISTPSKTQSRVRAGLWLAALAASFVVFAQLATGSELLWNDSTLLIAAAVLSVALLIVLSRARAQGIDARKAFLMSAVTLLWFVLICEQVFVHHVNSTASASAGRFGIEAFQEVAAWVLAALVLLFMTITRPRYLRQMFSGAYKWISFFALLALASVPLSPSASYSLAWTFKLILIVLLLQACASSMEGTDDIVSFLYAFLAGFFTLVLLRLVGTFTGSEPIFEGGRLGGVASPTGLSTLAGVLLLLAMTLFAVRRHGWLLITAAFGLFVMLLGGGKAGIAAGVISAMLFLVLQKRVRHALGLLVIVLVVGATLLATTPLSKYLEDYDRSGQASKLTGRTDLWTAVWPEILQKPVAGHGYVASRFLSFDVIVNGWEPSHTHNSFIEPLYNNGILGLLLVLIMNFIIVRNLLRAVKYPVDKNFFFLAVGGFAIYISLLISGMFKVTFGGAPDSCFMMFLALFVVSVKLQQMTENAPSTR
jgi:O-antigen ligase